MNYCQNCGDAVGEKSRYCKSCGSFLKPIEKFSLEEEDRKFCQHCGSAMGKRYCPSCGSYGRNIKLKTSVLNVGKLFGGGNTKKTIQNAGEQGKVGSIKELFTDLFIVREDWKSNVVNAGLFALMLAFLLGVLVFAINQGLIQSISATYKKIDPEVDVFVLKKVMNALDFKAIIWMLFTGGALHGNVTDKVYMNVNVSLIFPFISLPILIVLIWLMEYARKLVMKTERTLFMSAMQSGIFAFFSAILTFVFSYKSTFGTDGKTEEILGALQGVGQELGLNFGDCIALSVGCSAVTVCFSMFLVTFLSLIILPGLKVTHDIWREVRKTVTIFLGVILCMTVLPGMVSAIVLVSDVPMLDFKSGILLFVLATGAYSSAIFTGKAQWCDFSATLPQLIKEIKGDGVDLDVFSVRAESSWTKFFCQFSGNEYLGNNDATVSSMPFTFLHICMLVVGIIAVLYISVKVWKKFSCDWQMAAVLSLITGAGCAVFLELLHRLFHVGGEVTVNTYTARLYVGEGALFLNFLKETIFIGILCMVGYGIWHFAAEKVALFMNLKTEWLLLGVCGCCLFLSVLGVSNIKLRKFRPVIENVGTEAYEFVVENATSEDVYEHDRECELREFTNEGLKMLNELLEYDPKMHNGKFDDIFNDNTSDMSEDYY